MNNYIEYRDSMAFHPGYYIEEIVDESGLTQQDFAKRLDTTPKNLSKLINAEQRLSVDMAMKLSKLLGTTVEYWLNLQNAYDAVLAQMAYDKEMEEEKRVLKILGYGYFRDYFGLPDVPRRIEEQVSLVRKHLQVASLTVLLNRNLAVNFRSSADVLSEENTARANAMVQVAVNEALKIDAPEFSRSKFKTAVEFALTQTNNYNGFFPLIRERFLEAGVILVALPNLNGSKTNGATKKLGKSVMLMVNDRHQHADSFWFTLMHEVGHVVNNDFGISFTDESGDAEMAADEYARNALIDPGMYQSFKDGGVFTLDAIREFASAIGRDPGIVLGRLQKDGLVSYGNLVLSSLRKKISFRCAV